MQARFWKPLLFAICASCVVAGFVFAQTPGPRVTPPRLEQPAPSVRGPGV